MPPVSAARAIRRVLAVLAALAILLPVLSHAGWPRNHNGTVDFSRMAAFTGQWALGHPIVVWSTTEQWGFGSPAPALYNKSFFYAASAVLAVTGSPKAGVAIALLAFMTLAFLGAANAVRQALGRSDLLAEATAGVLVVSCNYATTDWLVRGAFAEFAALACTPWVFAWAIRLIVRGAWSVWIGPILAAVTLSHVIIGLYSLFPLAIAAALAAALWRRAALGWWRPAALSVALFVALILPFEAPLLVFQAWANVAALDIYQPRATHLPFTRLFWDTHWVFGQRWDDYTVQLDLVPLAGLVLALVPALLRRNGVRWRIAADRRTAATLFLVATAALVLYLQTVSGLWLFEAVPLLAVIQFSWRLLTFLSVAVAIGCGLLVGGIGRRPGRPRLAATAVAVVLVASTVTNKPWWNGIHYAWFSPAEIAQSQRNDVIAGGEYLPRITATTLHPGRTPEEAGRNVWQPAADTAGTPCQVVREGARDREQAAIRFQLHCTAAGEAVLPIFDAPGMRVSVSHGGRTLPVAHTRRCDDARLRLPVADGDSRVVVATPHWWPVIADAIMGDGFGAPRSCPGPMPPPDRS